MAEETRKYIIRNLTFVAVLTIVSALAVTLAIVLTDPPVEVTALVTPFFTIGGAAVGGIGVAYTTRSETSP